MKKNITDIVKNILDEKLLYDVINDFVNVFKDQTIKDVKLSILARRN